MANVNAPSGLMPVRYRSGKAYTAGGQEAFAFDATDALAVGDPVVFFGDATTDGVPHVSRSSVGGKIDGIIVGMLSDPGTDILTRDNPRIIPASAASGGAFVLIESDPDLFYEIQEDSDGGFIPAASVGLHADLIFAAPDAVNGRSKVQIDSSTVLADLDGTLQVKIVALVKRANNEIGTNAKWLVTINKTSWRSFGSSN